MTKVRVGVLGCGNVMVPYMTLAEKLAREGLLEVVIACDRAESKRAVALKHGIPRFTTDPQEVTGARDVDLVLVLTPMQDHAPAACAALQAGKHVLVEKTLAPTLEEAARLVEIAKKSPGLLLCAPHVLLSPTYQAIRKRIRDGAIGKVLSCRARYGWSDPYWQSGWVYKRGAGALFEFAVYNITSLTGILGPARKVTAMTGVAVPEREIGGERVKVEAEDNGHVLLDFGEGVLAAVTTGFTLQRYRSPAIEFYGSEGTIQMMGDDWAPQGYELWENAAGSWKIYDETDPGWSWTDGLRHIVECIRTKQRPIAPPEHAYHVLEILIRAQEAGADGKMRVLQSRFSYV